MENNNNNNGKEERQCDGCLLIYYKLYCPHKKRHRDRCQSCSVFLLNNVI